MRQEIMQEMFSSLLTATTLIMVCLAIALANLYVARESWRTAKGKDTWCARLQRRHDTAVNPHWLLRICCYWPKWMDTWEKRRAAFYVLALGCGAMGCLFLYIFVKGLYQLVIALIDIVRNLS